MTVHSQNLKLLCLNPFVGIVDDVFDRDLADHIIARGQDRLRPAKVVSQTGGKSKSSENRTNYNSVVNQWDDPRMSALVSKISEFVRLPPENTETSQLLRYQGEQKFDPHPDAFGNTVGGRQARASGGQRLFTTICYLNDVEGGGETEFPKLKFKVAPKLGRVLIFGNTLLGTAEAHPDSYHAGRPVTGGEKFVLSLWWRQLAYHVQRSYPPEKGETVTIS